MAFIDTSLAFSSFTTPVAVTSTADSSVVDLTGAGVGNAPAMIGAGGVNTAMGYDLGNADGLATPWLYFVVNTALTGNTGTLQISLKAAPDSGTYTEGSYTTLYTSAVFTIAQLYAGATLLVPVPPRALEGDPGEAIPRFYKLTYTVGSGPFTAGKVSAGILLSPPAGLVSTLYGNNFVVV